MAGQLVNRRRLRLSLRVENPLYGNTLLLEGALLRCRGVATLQSLAAADLLRTGPEALCLDRHAPEIWEYCDTTYDFMTCLTPRQQICWAIMSPAAQNTLQRGRAASHRAGAMDMGPAVDCLRSCRDAFLLRGWPGAAAARCTSSEYGGRLVSAFRDCFQTLLSLVATNALAPDHLDVCTQATSMATSIGEIAHLGMSEAASAGWGAEALSASESVLTSLLHLSSRLVMGRVESYQIDAGTLCLSESQFEGLDRIHRSLFARNLPLGNTGQAADFLVAGIAGDFCDRRIGRDGTLDAALDTIFRPEMTLLNRTEDFAAARHTWRENIASLKKTAEEALTTVQSLRIMVPGGNRGQDALLIAVKVCRRLSELRYEPNV